MERFWGFPEFSPWPLSYFSLFQGNSDPQLHTLTLITLGLISPLHSDTYFQLTSGQLLTDHAGK